jgi:hypothetical protein
MSAQLEGELASTKETLRDRDMANRLLRCRRPRTIMFV